MVRGETNLSCKAHNGTELTLPVFPARGRLPLPEVAGGFISLATALLFLNTVAPACPS